MLGFRVWDSEQKKMITDDYYFYMADDGDLVCINDAGVIYDPAAHKVPMQSTGLKDCTGVEIFEGDIIQTEHVTFKIRRIALVENVTNFLQDTPRSGFRYELKILGNQYENPELLSEINKLIKFNNDETLD